MNLEVLICIST